MTLAARLAEKRLIVCAGSGGVGKTTTSAAVALHAAAQGRRTLVITIDPAKRLAQSLGLDALDNQERRVDPARFSEAGLLVKGELYAAMLDTQAAFDALIRRITPSPLQAERILGNRVYRQISTALTGSPEYVAMERLYEIMHRGAYDLVVLDTPPTKNALDFLEAPNRLAGFLDEGIVGAFLKNSEKARSRWLAGPSAMVYKLLGLLLGDSFVGDLTEFFQAFSGLYGGFRERAREVEALLREPATLFLLVTAAERNALDEAHYFLRKLKGAGIPLGAVVVNRAYHEPTQGALEAGNPLSALEGARVAQAMGHETQLTEALGRWPEKLSRLRHLRREQDEAASQAIARFADSLNDPALPVLRVPRLRRDVHDLPGLWRLNHYLFDPIHAT